MSILFDVSGGPRLQLWIPHLLSCSDPTQPHIPNGSKKSYPSGVHEAYLRCGKVYEPNNTLTAIEKRVIANDAISACPHCPEAFIILAQLETSPEAQLAMITQGEAIGLLAVLQSDAKVAAKERLCYKLPALRPHFFCLHAKAELLRQLGRYSEAIGNYWRLLEIQKEPTAFFSWQNPAKMFSYLLIQLERWDECEKLYESYPSYLKDSPFGFSKLLLRFRAHQSLDHPVRSLVFLKRAYFLPDGAIYTKDTLTMLDKWPSLPLLLLGLHRRTLGADGPPLQSDEIAYAKMFGVIFSSQSGLAEALAIVARRPWIQMYRLARTAASMTDDQRVAGSPSHLSTLPSRTQCAAVLRALGCSTAEDFVCNDGTLLHTNLLRHGDVEGLKLLNTKFRIALASIPPSMPSFRTALHHAVESQSILAVQFVLQQKAPLNSKDAKGKTPLYLAATRGQWKMVDLILQQSPGLGMIPIQYKGEEISLLEACMASRLVACHYGRGKCARCTKAWVGSGDNGISHHNEGCDPARTVQVIIRRTKNIDIKIQGEPILHYALNHFPECVTALLLRPDCPVNTLNYLAGTTELVTPLLWLAIKGPKQLGRERTVAFLNDLTQSHAARIDFAVKYKGTTAIEILRTLGWQEVARALEVNQASVAGPGPTIEEQRIKRCSVCGSANRPPRKCGRCHSIFYCGADCQKEDWPKHKLECRPADI